MGGIVKTEMGEGFRKTHSSWRNALPGIEDVLRHVFLHQTKERPLFFKKMCFPDDENGLINQGILLQSFVLGENNEEEKHLHMYYSLEEPFYFGLKL